MKYVLLVLLCACDGISSHPQAVDARPEPDAPPDAGHFVRHYVIDSMLYPTSLTQGREWSVDFTGEGVPDNTFGSTLLTLAGYGVPTQKSTDTKVNDGTVLLLAELTSESPDFADAPATFTLFGGANPTPPACHNAKCRLHLDGNGTFDLDPTAIHDTPVAGVLTGTTMLSEPGHLVVTLGLGAAAVQISLIGARVRIDTTTPVAASGTIMGGITKEQLDQRLAPALADAIDAEVARDCSGGAGGCFCAAGTNGQRLQLRYDDNHDCHVRLLEFVANNDVAVKLTPDAMVEGVAVSTLAFHFTAVTGTFTP